MDTKALIDQKYSHPSMRKLMYWKHGDHPECAAEIGDEFTAGNQDFADHVCALIDYASSMAEDNRQLKNSFLDLTGQDWDSTK